VLGKKSILIMVALTGVQFVYGMEQENRVLPLDAPTDSCTLVYKLFEKAIKIPNEKAIKLSNDEVIKRYKEKKDKDRIRSFTRREGSESHRVLLGDGNVAVACYGSNIIKVFSTETGEKKDEEFEGPANVVCVAFLKKNKLAYGCANGSIGAWDTKTGQEIHVSKGHAHEVLRLASLGNDRLASEDCNGTKELWDLTCFRDDLSTEQKKLYSMLYDKKKRINATNISTFIPWIKSFFYQGDPVAKDQKNCNTFKTLPNDIQWRTIEKKWVSLSRDERRQLEIPKRKQYLDTDGTLRDVLSKKDD